MTPVAESATAQVSVAEATASLLATQYGTWYPWLRQNTPKSVVIDLEEVEPAFVQWLDEDGLALSDANDDHRVQRSIPRDDDAEVLSEPSDDGDENGAYFPALSARIAEVLRDFHAVFPKLNWSAPQDAAWIMPGHTLKCQTPNDVFLLLKSSDFAMKDLVQLRELQKACEAERRPERPRLQLVLKKWFDMPRSHEFRCFVRDGQLIGACQRDVTYYEHLQDPAVQAQIQRMLAKCYRAHIAPHAPTNIVWDVYLTRHLDRAFVMDLNPWLPRTDTLLWTFDELHAAPALEPVPLRVLTSAAQATQALPTYSAHMVPADVVAMSQGQMV
ncbi:hypothetical protein MCAP1_001525 [Malassezia caprae]|uniref:Cell division cycle protein 123 n=1 Tax=Malassezia caprae TaxID=1381934 RepID=A0AAF0IZS0_9BASI|nr:hypothetical protein MCAP1_001525 [Malassezia caprae]